MSKLEQMKICLIVCFILSLVPLKGRAEDVIPRENFIAITSSALDALDEADVTFDTYGSTDAERRAAINKLEVSLKKYDRALKVKPMPDGKQKDIVGAIMIAHLKLYGLLLSRRGEMQEMKEIKSHVEKAHSLFEKYQMDK
jgi:hypothetical protein